MVHKNISFSEALFVTKLVLHNCALCNMVSPYIIIEGVFNTKMKFIFITLGAMGTYSSS